MNLEDAIAKSKVDRMYILLGSNDIADSNNRVAFLDNWNIMLGRIREKSPDVEIVVISNIPQYSASDLNQTGDIVTYNALVKEYNGKLKQFCQENDCLFLDLYYYILDHHGSIPQEYNLDGYHLSDLGYMNWIKIMRYYAEYELAGGTLS